MGLAVLVFAGVLLGGAWSAPTPEVASPELILQPPLLQVAPVAVPVTYISRHHAQDELGQVDYGFSHPGQAKNEMRDASGNVAGVYTYVDDDDKIIRVEYTAGKDGFQVKGNNLPEGVKDTQEVLAAKLQFVEAYNAAALAAASAADDSDGEVAKSEDQEAVNVAFPVHIVQSPTKDTPEVIAAKLRFVEAYNAAALAAANAPDEPVEASVDTEAKTASVANYTPVKDTPEVIAAKLQFVEAYNTAALAAAAADDDPESKDSSKAVLTYANHAVQDTPEVTAAKLQFVEAYNAAAIAAALAPDDDVVTDTSQSDADTAETSEVTEKPFVADESATDLGGFDMQANDVTPFPDEDDEITTIFPGRKQKELQEQTQTRKINVLKPVKVTEPPIAENEASISAVLVPQAHSYSIVPPVQTSNIESSVILTPTVYLTALQPNDPVIGVPETHVSRHHIQDELGQVNYGFSHPGQAKNELRAANGNVAGVYTYIDDRDEVVHVEYTAGEDGFQVRSNKLPEAVRDTPEVLAAKLQFVKAYNAAALAAAAAPDDDDGKANEVADSDTSRTTFVLPNPVKDTPEVIAAKLQFAEAYNAAALAAASAPDDPVGSSAVERESATLVNPNLVQDTPEVINAKLQFVEAYNQAALAAAKAADNTDADSASKVAVVYATPVVQDTPEVIVAKLKFVEAYNAAAIAAALAPDDDNQQQKTDVYNEESRSRLASETSSILLPPLFSESIDFSNAANDIAIPVPQELQPSSVVSQIRSPSLQAPVVLQSALPVSVVEVPVQEPVVVPVIHISRHHAQDELGQVNYGFSHPGQAKNEIRDSSGNVAGVYTYKDSDDKLVHVEYTAGEGGFQVQSNNLPVAVKDTPEVLAAKLQFVEAYNAAALAAATAPDSDDVLPNEDMDNDASKISPVLVPTPVKDTPEVIAAKLQFVEAYNAAALAPDDLVVTSAHATKTLASPNLVKDTPEVIAAKLQFVETYNSAALAAAQAEDNFGSDDNYKVTVVYGTPVVLDTPEVTAAKLQFVEEYNAAALAAALASDDSVQEETEQKPENNSAVTSSGEDNSLTEVPQPQRVIEQISLHNPDDQEDSENLNAKYVSQTSQSSYKPEGTAFVDALKDQYTITYKAVPAIATSDLTSHLGLVRYSWYPTGDSKTSSLLHANSVPFGVYSLQPVISPYGFLPHTYMNSIPMDSQFPTHNYGSKKQTVMYAPTYTY